ncbi:MAG: AMIN domain-containing protein, partial [Acidobacteria bacterium]|nr:AMIN domain-containing protein [Acidobacteriota bacterium]
MRLHDFVKGTPDGCRVQQTRRGVCTVLAIAAVGASVSMAPSASPLPAAATIIESVHGTHAGNRTTVILRGDGQLTPANVEETPERPRRLVLDFAGVGASASAATQTAIDSPLAKTVRVAVSSRQPLVTRVVIELVEEATYHIERGADPAHELSVVFERAQTASTVMIAPLDGPASEPEPAISLD